MSPKHPSDMIDQLVCGTLRGSAYREALQWLDADAKRWRKCALAFLQEQAIEQDLQRMAGESLNWHSDGMSPVVDLGAVSQWANPRSRQHEEPLLAAHRSVSQLSPSQLSPSQLSPSQASPSQASPLKVNSSKANSSKLNNGYPRMALKLAGLAALLLLSFGVGWVGGMPGSRGFQISQNSSNKTDSLLADAIKNQEPQLAGSDHRANENSGWRVPLAGNQRPGSDGVSESHLRNVRYSDQDFQSTWALSGSAFRNNPALAGNLSRRLLPIDQEIPRELRELERMGRIRIETSSALMPIENEDGTSVLVPVQQLQIVPVVFSY